MYVFISSNQCVNFFFFLINKNVFYFIKETMYFDYIIIELNNRLKILQN